MFKRNKHLDVFGYLYISLSSNAEKKAGHIIKQEQGWRSGESTRLPPMWPGLDNQIRRHLWVEFVGSLLCSER